MSQRLYEQFENKEVITHPGGHFFPASSEHKPRYVSFLQDRLLEILESRELAESKNIAVDVDGQEEEEENGGGQADSSEDQSD